MKKGKFSPIQPNFAWSSRCCCLHRRRRCRCRRPCCCIMLLRFWLLLFHAWSTSPPNRNEVDILLLLASTHAVVSGVALARNIARHFLLNLFVFSHLIGALNLPRHMHDVTFWPIGVATVTLQKKLWAAKVRIAMPC